MVSEAPWIDKDYISALVGLIYPRLSVRMTQSNYPAFSDQRAFEAFNILFIFDPH